jgi:hypothetical protein
VQNVEDGIDGDWLLVDRVIAQRGSGKRKEYLVKWCGLEYGASTWEAADDLESPEDQVLLLTDYVGQAGLGETQGTYAYGKPCSLICYTCSISLKVASHMLIVISPNVTPGLLVSCLSERVWLTGHKRKRLESRLMNPHTLAAFWC